MSIARVFVFAIAGALAVAVTQPQSQQMWPVDDMTAAFVCGTRLPVLSGKFTPSAVVAPIADGSVLYYYQDPPLLTADYQGTVVLRDFTVVGDRRTMRIFYITRSGQWESEQFDRITTRSLNGVLASVFEPSWPMATLLDHIASWGSGLSVFWDNQGGSVLEFGGDGTAAPGQLPAGAKVISVLASPSNVAPVPITKMSETVQFSSHVVNLVVPGFGDDRALNGEYAFPLQTVAKKFYETFQDSYDTLVVIPQGIQLATFGGFHQNVQNSIEGIGQSIFDDSRSYGSQGALQGIEYQRSINNIGVKHEQAHQWGDYFNWSRIGAITVTDTAHTPVWADRETPVPTRVPWWLRLAQNDSGVWQSTAAPFPHRFPPMLLYAMGRLPKEQVPPVILFDNQQQLFSAPGTEAQGSFKTRTVYDVIGVSGERRGPSVANSISRANVIVSTRGLISAREMAYWNHYAQRSEDPNGTSVPGWSGDGSFDMATGVDLRTDIRPKSLPAIAGNRAVDDRSFSANDVVGVRLDGDIPARIHAGDRTTLAGEITEPPQVGTETVTVRVSKYQVGTAVVTQSRQVGANGRFEIALEFTPDQRGVYAMVVSLTRAGRITTLAPLIVD